jgi:DNA primase
MKKEGWDFPEALRVLAERAGVQLRPPTPEEAEQAEENERLRELLEDAVTFYRHNLTQTPAGKKALDYFRGRGLTDETVERFGLGYAPDAWEAGTAHFTSRGYSHEDLLASGLASERDSGGLYDRFRDRIMFPIRDSRGRMAGFGARTLDPEGIPKYLNSPQTGLFEKSHLLYGLDRARKTIRSQDQVVIVEGYMDVIGLHQAGFPNAVSPMGTALTEQQLRQIKRLTRRIVLALDADAAGDQATLRGLNVARQTLDREHDPVFDARGLLRHEARMQADIRVTTLPEGMDPDEIVLQDPEAWGRIIENARPIVIHVMETLAADRDLDDPKVKTEIAKQVLPLIADLPDPIERDTYRQRLARLLKVDERALMGVSPSRTPRRSRPRPRTAPPPPQGPGERSPLSATQPVAASLGASSYRHEAYCLGILMRRPDLIYHVDRALQEAGLARLAARDFQSTEHQEIVRLILKSLEQERAEPVHDVLANLPLSLMDRADDLLAATEKTDPHDSKVLEDLLRTILDLRRRRLNESINQVRHLMEEAKESGDIKAAEYIKIVSQHTRTMERLDRALKKV